MMTMLMKEDSIVAVMSPRNTSLVAGNHPSKNMKTMLMLIMELTMIVRMSLIIAPLVVDNPMRGVQKMPQNTLTMRVIVTVSPSPQPEDTTEEKLHALRKYARVTVVPGRTLDSAVMTTWAEK
jgi:hypothetical protein